MTPPVAPPRFTVVTPVFDPPPAVLVAAIESVRRQQFVDWELCLVDDASSAPLVRAVLDDAARTDSRIRVEHRPERGGISRATNDAIALGTGEFIAFLDHDDELHPEALAHVSAYVDRYDDVDYLYTDEDKIDERGRHFDPFLKPDWSPDRFRAQMYTAHLSVARRSVVERVGALYPEFDGAQDWDLVFRVTEDARRIVHVPEILYHWRTLESSTARAGTNVKPYAHDAARAAIDAHIVRTGVEGEAYPIDGYPGLFRVRPRLRSQPLVSIVIPTAGSRKIIDGVDTELVVHAVDSIVRRSTYPAYEIIVVADDHVGASTRRAIETAGGTRVRVVSYAKPFNFSDKVNTGTAHATGEHLLLLNDDVEVLPHDWRPGAARDVPSDWLEQLLVYSLQPGVGAVGARLLLPDGRLQHAGVVVVHGAPTHALYLEPGSEPGYFGAAFLTTDYLAVTGACLMTRRECFEKFGGLDVRLPVNYNDLAYGLALHDAGLRSVFVPDVRLLHFESATREAGPVRPDELEYVREQWPDAFVRDPYYHSGFVTSRSDFFLPVYRASGTFARHGRVGAKAARVRQLLSEGGVRMLAQRVWNRVRPTSESAAE
jgi:glycosyltransferase involved in cell wall biosynthesis